MTTPTPAAEAKACCAAAYSSDLARLILGDSFHPGGAALTRRLARAAGLRGGERVLDVASGPGTTALLLAREFGVTVEGLELSPESVERANTAAAAEGLQERVSFRVGDAECLPFPAASFDVVTCECAFCTFPDKAKAAAEFARVLKPGGRVAFSDVTVDSDGLPPDLAGIAGWVACLADAKPLQVYAQLLRDAGLEPVLLEPQDDALAEMIDRIHARLTVLRTVARTTPALQGVDIGRALELTAQASAAAARGSIGYGLLVATRTPT